VYVHGGEFTSPNQEKFYHYRDLWRFELETNAWESLPSKTGPSARSGHRMIVHPNGKSLLMFGGFYDTGNEIRYYNDVWELALESKTWHLRCGGGGGGAAALEGPSPRSAAHVSGAFTDQTFFTLRSVSTLDRISFQLTDEHFDPQRTGTACSSTAGTANTRATATATTATWRKGRRTRICGR
jgi:hypothetical protein